MIHKNYLILPHHTIIHRGMTMTESPAYQVEEKEGKFEIRLYPGYILAQVDIEADFDNALGKGFSILASYIFGANKKKIRYCYDGTCF